MKSRKSIILGADRNQMDIRPILNCVLRLRQAVDQSTRQGAILDIIIMNLINNVLLHTYRTEFIQVITIHFVLRLNLHIITAY